MTAHTSDVICYYHDPVKAPLLREAVLPAMSAAAAGIAAHVERGWLHGPHVRIRLNAEPSAVEAAANSVADRLARHLRAHPSRARLSHARLLELSVAAGRAELVPPPYEPFEPDNAVRIAPPDPAALARLPGSRETAEVRAELLRAGVPALRETLKHLGRHGDTPGARVRAAVVAMTVRGATAPRGLAINYFSYRSHLEIYLHHGDPAGRIRAAQGAAWRRHRGEVTALVERGMAASGDDDDDEQSDLTAAWRRWSVSAWRIAAAAYDRGVLASASQEETFRRAADFGDARVSRLYSKDDISEFHRMLPQRDLEPERKREFEIDRFCINVLYVLLAVADVTPAERYLATGLVCEAVEDMTGLTWRDRLTTPASEGATPR